MKICENAISSYIWSKHTGLFVFFLKFGDAKFIFYIPFFLHTNVKEN